VEGGEDQGILGSGILRVQQVGRGWVEVGKIHEPAAAFLLIGFEEGFAEDIDDGGLGFGADGEQGAFLLFRGEEGIIAHDTGLILDGSAHVPNVIGDGGGHGVVEGEGEEGLEIVIERALEIREALGGEAITDAVVEFDFGGFQAEGGLGIGVDDLEELLLFEGEGAFQSEQGFEFLTGSGKAAETFAEVLGEGTGAQLVLFQFLRRKGGGEGGAEGGLFGEFAFLAGFGFGEEGDVLLGQAPAGEGLGDRLAFFGGEELQIAIPHGLGGELVELDTDGGIAEEIADQLAALTFQGGVGVIAGAVGGALLWVFVGMMPVLPIGRFGFEGVESVGEELVDIGEDDITEGGFRAADAAEVGDIDGVILGLDFAPMEGGRGGADVDGGKILKAESGGTGVGAQGQIRGREDGGLELQAGVAELTGQKESDAGQADNDSCESGDDQPGSHAGNKVRFERSKAMPTAVEATAALGRDTPLRRPAGTWQ
jgi:hypothetical protein